MRILTPSVFEAQVVTADDNSITLTAGSSTFTWVSTGGTNAFKAFKTGDTVYATVAISPDQFELPGGYTSESIKTTHN